MPHMKSVSRQVWDNTTTENMEQLRDLVQQKMQEMNLGYKKLGKMLGLSNSTIHRFIRDGKDITLITAIKLMNWIEVEGE